MRRTYRPVAAVLAVMMTAAAAAGCGGPARPADDGMPSVLADCAGKPQVQPNLVIIRCNDMGLTVRNVKWSDWGSRVAIGYGTGVYNVCEYSDCHTGSWNSFPTVVIVSGVLKCPNGKHAYARVQSMFAGNFTDWPTVDLMQMFPRPCGFVPGSVVYEPRMSLG